MSTKLSTIKGSGGGGKDGGGGGGGISESADTLSSVALARVVDLVGEGEIGGLVNGECSIFLDGVPIMNSDGSTNFSSYSYDTRVGTQDQSPMQAFSETEEEYAVNVKLTKSGGIKWMPLNDFGADYVRLTVSVPGLTTTSNNGSISGGSVSFRVYYKNGDSISPNITEPIHTETISGKTRSKYQRSIKLKTEGFGGWLHWAPAYVGIERVTDDSSSSLVQNDLYWDSYTVINTEKFSYPNSALVGMQLDSRKFSSVPTRTYHVKGLLVRVPENYDPVARTYDGIWNGAWKIAHTDNPAWCLYDLLTNPRYGLGKRISPSMIDKAALYEIAKYCDEPVPTGYDTDHTQSHSSQGFDAFGRSTSSVPTIIGNTEPRFTLNCVINTKEDAYKVLNQLTSVFRGMTYWRNNSITFSQDRPGEVEMLFNAANVIDGMFTYQGSARSQRHSVCLVGWNDPSDNFKQKYEYIEDKDAMLRYGFRQTDIVAFGCTSRSQARRVGLWLLYTERMETDACIFRASMDSFFLQPGSIVAISDPAKAGKRVGGRAIAMTSTSLTMDAPLTLGVGAHILSLMAKDGKPIYREVNITTAGDYTTLNFSLPVDVTYLTWEDMTGMFQDAVGAWDNAYIPQGSVSNQIWMLSTPDVSPRLSRVVGIKEVEKNVLEITTVAHNPSKYGSIERGDLLELPDYSALTLEVPPVTGLTLEESTYRANPQDPATTTLLISWDSGPANIVRGYKVVTVSGGTTVNHPEQSDTTLELRGIPAGQVDVYVQAVSITGSKGETAYATILVTGIDNTPPSDVTGLAVSVTTDKRYALTWNDIVDFIKFYEVRMGETWATATLLGKVKATSFTIPPMAAGSYTLWVAAVDGSDLYSVNPSSTTLTIAELPAPTGLSITSAVGNITVKVDESPSPIFYGIEVYASTTDGFTPLPTNKVYEGTNTQAAIMKMADGSALPIAVPIYVRVRYTSLVGANSTNYTAQTAVTLDSFSANLLRLTSDSQVFKVDDLGTVTPSVISLTAVLSGSLTGTVSWSSTGSTLSGTGNSRTVSYASLGSNTSTTVTATLVQDGKTYTDSVTLVKVIDGSNAISAFLTNEAVAVPADASGSVISYAGASTQIKVFRGATDDTANWTISRVNGPNVSSTLVGSTVTLTDLTSDADIITITATNGANSVQKIFSVSRVKQGANGTSGANGTRGSIQAYRSITGSTWNNTEADAAILAFTGASTKVIGDTVTLSNTSVSYAETRFWDGSVWATIGTVLNGNLLVNGTVTGSKIASNTITATHIDATDLVAQKVNVGATGTGARLVITNTVIKVYDASGTLRVKIGDLSA